MVFFGTVRQNDIEQILDSYPLVKKSRGNNRGKGKKKIVDCIAAFDIETTTVDDDTFMYIWALSFEGEITIYGRTWTEFMRLIEMIEDSLQGRELVIFIHNLAYEWQFMKSLRRVEEEDIFFIDSRKPLFFRWDHIEFRCSYRWSNMSLAKLTSSLEVQHKKLEGFDYITERYPDTPLNELEMLYMHNDVRGLCEGIRKKITLDGDTLITMPRTSTGYVRRDVKKAMRDYSRQSLKNTLPDYDLYLALREGFRGGNTHANRWYAGEIQSGEVWSFR